MPHPPTTNYHNYNAVQFQRQGRRPHNRRRVVLGPIKCHIEDLKLFISLNVEEEESPLHPARGFAWMVTRWILFSTRGL